MAIIPVDANNRDGCPENYKWPVPSPSSPISLRRRPRTRARSSNDAGRLPVATAPSPSPASRRRRRLCRLRALPRLLARVLPAAKFPHPHGRPSRRASASSPPRRRRRPQLARGHSGKSPAPLALHAPYPCPDRAQARYVYVR